MASETGHAKNVANFEDLISFATGYGATYNPSKNSLKIPQLQALLTSARAQLSAVNTGTTNLNNAINARKLAFEGIRKLSTKLVNALDATNATKEMVKDAQTINRKIQGARAKTIEAEAPATETTLGSRETAEPAPKTISVSQQSYDSIIEHFSKMITLLSSEASYAPNENDLKIATLNTRIASLRTANTNVINATTAANNARIARNKTLYDEAGLVATAMEVKKYIKSVFGAGSPEYDQVDGLEFKKRKS